MRLPCNPLLSPPEPLPPDQTQASLLAIGIVIRQHLTKIRTANNGSFLNPARSPESPLVFRAPRVTDIHLHFTTLQRSLDVYTEEDAAPHPRSHILDSIQRGGPANNAGNPSAGLSLHLQRHPIYASFNSTPSPIPISHLAARFDHLDSINQTRSSSAPSARAMPAHPELYTRSEDAHRLLCGQPGVEGAPAG